MSEKMRLRVEHTRNGTPLLYDQAGVQVASVWAGDRQAEHICAAVNAYDPDAVPAMPQGVGAMLESVSESQWIPLPRGAINIGTGNVTSWYTGTLGAVEVAFVGSNDGPTLFGDSAVLFLRYMASVMGDAFPPALRELLA